MQTPSARPGRTCLYPVLDLSSGEIKPCGNELHGRGRWKLCLIHKVEARKEQTRESQKRYQAREHMLDPFLFLVQSHLDGMSECRREKLLASWMADPMIHAYLTSARFPEEKFASDGWEEEEHREEAEKLCQKWGLKPVRRNFRRASDLEYTYWLFLFRFILLFPKHSWATDLRPVDLKDPDFLKQVAEFQRLCEWFWEQVGKALPGEIKKSHGLTNTHEIRAAQMRAFLSSGSQEQLAVLLTDMEDVLEQLASFCFELLLQYKVPG